MAASSPPEHDLKRENAELRLRLEEAEEVIRALHAGEVDALVVATPEGQKVYALEGADHAYRVLIEQMIPGAATLTPEGVVLYCNQSFAKLVGQPLESIIGASVAPYMQPADLARLSHESLSKSCGVASLESVMTRADGTSVPVSLSINDLSAYELSAVCMVVTDLTEERRTQRLLASAKLTNAVLDQAGDAIIVTDAEGVVIRANVAAQRLCDLEPVRMMFDAAFPLRLPSDAPGQAGARITAAELARESKRGVNVVLRMPDGTRAELLLTSSPLSDDADQTIGAVITLADVTDIKRTQTELARHRDQLAAMVAEATAELRVLGQRVLNAEEAERRRIAIGVHDDISQALALAKMKLQMMHQTGHGGADIPGMDELVALLGRIIGSTRDLTFDLSPPVLFELGLAPALGWLADILDRQHGLCVEIVADETPTPLSHDSAIVLFRSTRELLMNVVKHSGQQTARVAVSREDGAVKIVVCDKGKGFASPEEPPTEGGAKGFGLSSIRERMGYIGGTMVVSSTPGKGTQVTLTAPLES